MPGARVQHADRIANVEALACQPGIDLWESI
jgi:hypothetical protein